VAITDHDYLEGAFKIAHEADLLVIPGIEIASAEGHIVALGIRNPVPSRLSVEESVDKIHAAEGVAIACHPTGFFKGGLGKHVSSKFDAVEVINSSAIPFGYSVRQNERIASRLDKPRVAGSDAHYGPEIGYAYTLIDCKLDASAAVDAIRKGLCRPFGRPIPLGMRFRKTGALWARKFQSKKLS
jgi:predicted metal-dependent phosphoesterase TrpH